MMKKIASYIFSCSVMFAVQAWAYTPPEPQSHLGLHNYQAAPTSGFVLRFQPAFFWGTLGIEAEYALNEKMAVGVGLLGKMGNFEGKNNTSKLRQEDYLSSGMMAELFFRYYFKTKDGAPFGWYLHAGGGYNSIIYFDGNVRPFTFHNRWKKLDNFQSPSFIEKPRPYFGTVGAGYQLVVIPDRIVGNVMTGVQLSFDNENKAFISIYLSPSLGFLF